MKVDCVAAAQAANNQKSWYTYNRIDAYGSPDDAGSGQGNFSKPDSNILAPSGTAITALASGKVTDISRNVLWGDSVTIKLDYPYNDLATHVAYNYINVCSDLNVGDSVGANQLVGVAGQKSAAPAFAFWPGDIYGQGSWWNQYYANNAGGTPKLDPTGFLDHIKGLDIIPDNSTAGNYTNQQGIPGISGTGFLGSGGTVNDFFASIGKDLPRIGKGILGGLLILVAVVMGVLSLMDRSPIPRGLAKGAAA